MASISVGHVAKGRIGARPPALLLPGPSCACVKLDCRRRARTEWTALTAGNGFRAAGIQGRKGARRGPARPEGVESRRSVQQEERKDEPEESSTENEEDLAGEVVDAEFQAEDLADAKPVEKSTSVESPEDIGKALSELRKERVASGVVDPANTSDFWKGVAEETRLIEWPPLPKVLGTTGVVVAMILGSSVVLLTVNAILAEGSDFIFTNPSFREFAKGTLNLYW